LSRRTPSQRSRYWPSSDASLRLLLLAYAVTGFLVAAVPVAVVGGVPVTVLGYPDSGPVHVYIDEAMRARFCESLAMMGYGFLAVAAAAYRSYDALLVAAAGALAGEVCAWRHVDALISQHVLEGASNGWLLRADVSPAAGATALYLHLLYGAAVLIITSVAASAHRDQSPQ